jgi:hypothetical protein
MESEDLRIGREIIDLLKDNGIELEIGIKNQIILKVCEAYEMGRENGFREGLEESCNMIKDKLEGIE